ncbi:Uncharacterised protein [Acholeplasma oculi]|uniref:Transcriptional regulator, AbiEi antitoxin, Type IV TA system n=1 Tax=Acholeplasma oculi TaxID=35623 RepID=A0A061AJR7_9MOLU|nr:DUF6088 family protein [Acholeplasma oculi]CDR31212.1 hypothetical protein Aocu_11390 [Acholeplasma oculi]SKC38000.1 hypothetical protein SAMN02745122_0569 [Acholeplasma oculi]SUT91215.1 Uncharacterised protein [Acholeplasma oculi]
MGNLSLIDRIYDFIKSSYKSGQPFFLKDLYKHFPEINDGTIRESIRRLIDKEKILKAKNGVYELPNPNRVLKSHVVNISNVVEQTYLKDKENNIIGYRSGINFANQLGLTSQTASVEVVYSNNVSNRKREIKLNKSRLIINAPRIKVTNKNYKLLQILDLLTEFEKYSEYDLKQVESKILSYLSGIKLSPDQLERIVEAYPLAAQVKFYKIGGANVITQR